MYQQVATDIIKESIKSAIFIDENAWEPFTSKPRKKPIPQEVKLSEDLFINFKNSGISLTTYRFTTLKNAEDAANYLFEKRDLVLLDWKLAGNDGAEYSLNILSNIVKKPHIHFCAIYTSQSDLDQIFWNLLSYFSNGSKEYYEELKLTLAGDEEEISQLLSDFKTLSETRFERSSKQLLGRIIRNNTALISRILESSGEKDKLCACIKTGIAFGNEIKSVENLECPSVISSDRRTLTINNTVITILNKTQNQPNELINNFSEQISHSNHSFMQLLGLEMQWIFSQKASFIDPSILQVSKEAFIYHRIQKDKDSFSQFVKEVLFEQARLNLREEEFKLLDDDLLNYITPENFTSVNDDEIQAMNIFYNSSVLKGDRGLNFGDVFKSGDKYYICITALCDCHTPKRNGFYFAEGKIIVPKKALELGDTAFISYLSKNVIIRWTEDQDSDGAQFKPVYIKPISFTVPDYKIKDNKIIFYFLEETAKTSSIVGDYITTIKPNYTQRIANHAFSHPVRVGIDFVKKDKTPNV
ncbi:MAG TPA: response regulator receiver domain [Paludibacter sp.]